MCNIKDYSSGECELDRGKTEALKDTIQSLTSKYIHIWWELCSKPAIKFDSTADFFTRRRRQLLTDKFLKSFIEKIKNYPSNAEGRIRWDTEVRLLIEWFLKQIQFVNINHIKYLLSQGILEATETFVERARSFDSNVNIEDIGQAMRNVWIMNIIQVLLGEEVKCSSSVFAYSMLYPYTDNYIDSDGLEPHEKLRYSLRFEKRLKGEKIASQNDLESKIFSLVELIEEQYERNKFPEVYGSLLGIHRGQNKSILQHKGGTTPYELDLLGISMEKGGASVLADGFLVKGNLNPIEIEFFYIYGIMLQLCDDLQDVRMDTKNNHNTIFSLTAKAWPIDNITDGLFNLVDYVVQFIDKLDIKNPELTKSIIKDNCHLLIYFAIAKNKNFYTKTYIRNIGGNFPYNTGYLKRFHKKLSKEYRKLKPAYNGVSTEKILLEGIKALSKV